ncbi:MAG: hypothetical protein ABI797_05370 [Chloroflexota bacterium]
MNFESLLTALIGAFFGASGWLLVGLFMARRSALAQARNAARAVYFELAMNEIDIDVAAKHGIFGNLRRGSFDRLLPELATWLEVDELEIIARAYMSHAGYDQTQRDEKLPVPVKAALLGHVLAEHRAASSLLRKKSFSDKEAARLSTMAGGAAPAEGSAASAMSRGVGGG